MISRVVLAVAAVVASVGVLLFGMGSSYSPKWQRLEHLGLGMMIGGVIFMAIGVVWYRQAEAKIEAEMVAKYGPNRD